MRNCDTARTEGAIEFINVVFVSAVLKLWLFDLVSGLPFFGLSYLPQPRLEQHQFARDKQCAEDKLVVLRQP